MASDPSRLRQQLRSSEIQRAKEIAQLLAERQGLIRGTLGIRARVCGHSNCRCTQGQLHESKYLTATVEGGVRQVHVPAGDEVEVATGVKRYQKWRQRRREIAELSAQELEYIDELVSALLKPYPPDDPIPAARRRGRKKKGESNGDR